MRALLPWLVLLAGCWSSPAVAPPPPPAPAERLAPPAPVFEHGLTYEERWLGGALPGSDVPVIVAVHGMGDDPDHFAGLFEAWTTPAHLVLPRGPHALGEGHAWMTIRTIEGRDAELAAQLDASAARVAALCRELARDDRKPVLAGFSQGGMIAWTVASRHPDTIAGAVAVSGYLPDALRPQAGQAAPPIRVLHGQDDRIVPLALDLRSVDQAKEAGLDVTIEMFPAVGHQIPPNMRAALYREVAALHGG